MLKRKPKIAIFHCGFIYSGGGDPSPACHSSLGTIRSRLMARYGRGELIYYA